MSNDMFQHHRPLKQGEFIIVAIDTAGEGQDFNAGQFLSNERLDVPITLHYEGSITDVTPALKNLLEEINDKTGVQPVVCYETNNGGGYELERLSRLNKLQKYRIYYQYKIDTEGRLSKTDKMGWNTNSATRPVVLDGLKDIVNNHLIDIYHKPTVEEMFTFVKKRTASGWRAEAEVGAHDDLLMALGICWQLYQTEKPPVVFENTRRKPKRLKFHVGS